jgi:hypothetical protein
MLQNLVVGAWGAVNTGKHQLRKGRREDLDIRCLGARGYLAAVQQVALRYNEPQVSPQLHMAALSRR